MTWEPIVPILLKAVYQLGTIIDVVSPIGMGIWQFAVLSELEATVLRVFFKSPMLATCRCHPTLSHDMPLFRDETRQLPKSSQAFDIYVPADMSVWRSSDNGM